VSNDHFYMTYARSRPNELIPWIESHDVPLLTNAVHRYSENTDRLLPMWEYDTRHVIDAGGYNVMADYVTLNGELADNVGPFTVHHELATETPFYPWTIPEYDAWLTDHSNEFAWATVMDYACEDRFDPLWDYEDRVAATFENTLEHFNRDPDYKLLPVLQGRDVDEYVAFYDRLADHGIPTDHVGLGTVCRMSSEKRIASFEREIRERTGVERMHGFGVKIEAFQHGAGFNSADSQAWVYGPTNGKVVLDAGDRMRRVPMPDHSLARTVESFKNYYSYVTRLQQGESAVTYDPDVDMTADADRVEQTVAARY